MKRIMLNRETLRNLDRRDLQEIFGGANRPETAGPGGGTLSCSHFDPLQMCTECKTNVTV